MPETRRVLLTGATGFVGSHCHAVLREAGHEVVGGSRDPDAALRRFPGRTFRRLDVGDPTTLPGALAGCDAAVYLVHGMGDGRHDYEAEELAAARSFREAAARAGLQRVVYLGGVQPAEAPSPHLRSRRRTGECLREGGVPTLELRAAMIVGHGSESFRMVRDLAARLPCMVLPRWLRSLSQPISIRDVAIAIERSLSLPEATSSSVHDLPGPETLSAREILERTARRMGRRPRMWEVPLLTPRLSSLWVRLVTRSDGFIASELVQGLRSDLLAQSPHFWDRFPGHRLQPFDEAVDDALAAERGDVSLGGRALEAAVRRASRS